MELNLKFDVKDKRVIEINETGEIDILALYRSLREWEASETGIVFKEILNYSGSIELPDGTMTPTTLIFVNDWKLASKEKISIVGGYITGRDSQNKYVNPIVSESRFEITVLSNPEDETLFVPTEAQKQYALEQGNLFATDWEIITTPKPEIRRKTNASKQVHSIFGLYWFLKLEWLKNKEATKFKFPIKGDNQIPRGNIIRHYELLTPWSINNSDLEFLNNGPLIKDNEIIIEAVKNNSKGLVEDNVETESKWKEDIEKNVTIGIVTALTKEHAAMSLQIDEKTPYTIQNGRFNQAITTGTIPAFSNGKHVVALTMCEMGNNTAAITATQLQSQFRNMQVIIMVGIAGAVPNPSNYETHVRLGDIVISGQEGVIQYDMIKQNEEGNIEHRHHPRPPSNHLLQSVRVLDSERINGHRPWMTALDRTSSNTIYSRPDENKDILLSTEEPIVPVQHPNDPERINNEPKLFIGAIGAGNKLLKSACERDELREKFKLKAIEMESSGISDAARLSGLEYLVIRGTCDYCAPNKNNDWQFYAAAVASSYCRSLLEKTPIFNILLS